ncbi:hypothetical protein ACQRDF_15115 [Lachnospiraceae bacterium SGI.054]
MSYFEISNCFLHAASLSAEIKRFRIERLAALLEDNTGMFGVIHVVPASFTNPADSLPMCDLCKAGRIPISRKLNEYIRGRMYPNVDGVWFPSDDESRDFQLFRLFNNGSVELKCNLYTTKSMNEEYLVSAEFIQAIDDIVEGTAEIYKALGRKATVYVCVSLLECKGYWNYVSGVSVHPAASKIDRDRILCEPIEIKDISDGGKKLLQ